MTIPAGARVDWKSLQICDISAGLSDPTYKGYYKNKYLHEPDFDTVIKRGQAYGVCKYILVSEHVEDAE